MCTYLRNMEGYKAKDLKLFDFDVIQKMFDRAFKRQRVEDDKETAELKQLMEIITDEEDVAIDAILLAVNHMLKSFDRENLEDLYKLVKAKYGSTRPVEDLDLLLWGDLKTMFKPHVEDKLWKAQEGYKVLNWKLYDSCGVHSLTMQSMHIYMLVEKKYPLTPPTLTMMLEKKLQIDYQSEMAYQHFRVSAADELQRKYAKCTASTQLLLLVKVNTASTKLMLLRDCLKNNVAEKITTVYKIPFRHTKTMSKADVQKILNNYRVDNGKSVSVPLGAHFKMVCTTSDIAYAVSIVSMYLANRGKNHWEAMKWILKYLKGTADVCQVYERMKHINVRYHFIREIVESKEIEVAKIGTKDNIADAFTKVVPGLKFKYCMEILSVGAN
ncbi:hypothetical protein Tco_1228376 [Tanacetum coccineum]